MSCCHEVITVGARPSPLSCAQVQELLCALRFHHPCIAFSHLWLQTQGDKDKSRSLRSMDKSNFFTKEIDEALLLGLCSIAIHSAKDLPDPIPQGLAVVAITKGVDPCDSLVLRCNQGELPSAPLIATSSQRREECVLKLFPSACFCDVRGTIEGRLEQLDQGLFDGVVIAEAALIRLRLLHRHRLALTGATAPLQGRLAIVAREEDLAMQQLFSCLDVRGCLEL